MNLLYVHFLSEIGGGEKYFVNIINDICINNNAVLITPNKSSTFGRLINKQVKQYSFGFMRNFGPFPWLSWSLLKNTLPVIRREKIEVLHYSDHYLTPTILILKLLTNVKIVFTSHGKWDVHFFINRVLLKLLNPRVVCSTYTQYFRLVDFVKNITLVPMIVDETSFNATHKIDNNKIKVGIVGRFSPVKNHKLAFEIINLLDGSKFELHIFGDHTLDIAEETDAYRDEIYRLIQKSKNIVHHGIVHGQDNIYQGIDILLQTSFTEASSLVTVECQKYGIPLVCSLTEASSFAVIDGYNGFICQDIGAYVDAINAIVENYESFSKNSLNNSKRFLKESYINNLMSIYER